MAKILFLLALACTVVVVRGDGEQAVKDMIARVLPAVADQFKVSIHSALDKFDACILASTPSGHIQITASSPVGAASGFGYYLKYFMNCSISWSGDQLSFDATKALPVIPAEIKVAATSELSYYFNVCTFSYSTAWWSWERWQREIDFMAINGINAPLAFNGQEYVWQRVYAQFNLTGEDLADFFSGPAFYAWNRMGNIRGWLGPASIDKSTYQTFLQQQFDLQLKILNRMKEFGMTPILPAFAGHVPSALKQKYPKADITASSNWGNFPEKYCCVNLLEANDPLYTEIGSAFIREQMKLYGNVTHLYNADTFNELTPKTKDPEYLRLSSKAVYESITLADEKGILVMQAWLFLENKAFWGEAEIKALLSGIPDQGILLLDLAAELYPMWSRTQSFYNKPFIWSILHNYGGNLGLYGKMQVISSEPVKALAASTSMKGIGLTMEGIDQNFVIYDLMAEMRFHDSAVDTKRWIRDFHTRRYGAYSERADLAWQALLSTVYNNSNDYFGVTKSMIVLRPSFDLLHEGFMATKLYYDPLVIPVALSNLFAATCNYTEISEPFKYDSVDFTRQLLSNQFYDLHAQLVTAYKAKSAEQVANLANRMLHVISDMERILATNKYFSFANWIKDARAWGSDAAAKDYFELNARNQITLWGPTGQISDYASKQWSGLMQGYYYPRWKMFFTELNQALASRVSFNETKFEQDVLQFEEKWQYEHLTEEEESNGGENPIEVAKHILSKYYPALI